MLSYRLELWGAKIAERDLAEMMTYLDAQNLVVLMGFAILAVSGLAGTLWMGRLHRVALTRCNRLETEVVRSEEARGRLKYFLSDLVASFNLSLACYSGDSGEERRAEIQQLRLALQQELQGTQRTPPSRAVPAGPGDLHSIQSDGFRS